MKKTLATLMLLAVTLTAAAQTEMVRLTRFEGKKITGVSASSGFNVEVIKSDKTYAVVEVNASVEDRLTFEITPEGVVNIGLRNNKASMRNIELNAKVYMSDLRTLRASSGCDMKMVGDFESQSTTIDVSSGAEIEELRLNSKEKVSIMCSSAGNIEAKINSVSLSCDVSSAAKAELVHNGESSSLKSSSAAKINISGSVASSNINSNSSAAVNGEYYNIKKATIDASSASKVVIGQTEELNVNGSSASSIRYRGNPKMSTKISSASSLKKLD